MRGAKYRALTAQQIKPEGWLLRQLEIQAEGLSGHLDLVWPDVRESKWIGGDKEGWERVPYWLDGFIPLAYLLDDEDLKSVQKDISMRFWQPRRKTGGSAPVSRKNATVTTSGRHF